MISVLGKTQNTANKYAEFILILLLLFALSGCSNRNASTTVEEKLNVQDFDTTYRIDYKPLSILNDVISISVPRPWKVVLDPHEKEEWMQDSEGAGEWGFHVYTSDTFLDNYFYIAKTAGSRVHPIENNPNRSRAEIPIANGLTGDLVLDEGKDSLTGTIYFSHNKLYSVQLKFEKDYFNKNKVYILNMLKTLVIPISN